jgi:hypothetical protein
MLSPRNPANVSGLWFFPKVGFSCLIQSTSGLLFWYVNFTGTIPTFRSRAMVFDFGA